MNPMRIRSVSLLPDSQDYIVVCGHGRTAGGQAAEQPPQGRRFRLRDVLARHYARQGCKCSRDAWERMAGHDSGG